jgi:hypothetical protein
MRVRETTGVVRVLECFPTCNCWNPFVSCGKGSGKAYGKADGVGCASGRCALHWLLSYWCLIPSQRLYSEFISYA